MPLFSRSRPQVAIVAAAWRCVVVIEVRRSSVRGSPLRLAQVVPARALLSDVTSVPVVVVVLARSVVPPRFAVRARAQTRARLVVVRAQPRVGPLPHSVRPFARTLSFVVAASVVVRASALATFAFVVAGVAMVTAVMSVVVTGMVVAGVLSTVVFGRAFDGGSDDACGGT